VELVSHWRLHEGMAGIEMGFSFLNRLPISHFRGASPPPTRTIFKWLNGEIKMKRHSRLPNVFLNSHLSCAKNKFILKSNPNRYKKEKL